VSCGESVLAAQRQSSPLFLPRALDVAGVLMWLERITYSRIGRGEGHGDIQITAYRVPRIDYIAYIVYVNHAYKVIYLYIAIALE
jgi:hypothetical protein